MSHRTAAPSLALSPLDLTLTFYLEAQKAKQDESDWILNQNKSLYALRGPNHRITISAKDASISLNKIVGYRILFNGYLESFLEQLTQLKNNTEDPAARRMIASVSTRPLNSLKVSTKYLSDSVAKLRKTVTDLDTTAYNEECQKTQEIFQKFADRSSQSFSKFKQSYTLSFGLKTLSKTVSSYLEASSFRYDESCKIKELSPKKEATISLNQITDTVKVITAYRKSFNKSLKEFFENLTQLKTEATDLNENKTVLSYANKYVSRLEAPPANLKLLTSNQGIIVIDCGAYEQAFQTSDQTFTFFKKELSLETVVARGQR